VKNVKFGYFIRVTEFICCNNLERSFALPSDKKKWKTERKKMENRAKKMERKKKKRKKKKSYNNKQI